MLEHTYPFPPSTSKFIATLTHSHLLLPSLLPHSPYPLPHNSSNFFSLFSLLTRTTPTSPNQSMPPSSKFIKFIKTLISPPPTFQLTSISISSHTPIVSLQFLDLCWMERKNWERFWARVLDVYLSLKSVIKFPFLIQIRVHHLIHLKFSQIKWEISFFLVPNFMFWIWWVTNSRILELRGVNVFLLRDFG